MNFTGWQKVLLIIIPFIIVSGISQLIGAIIMNAPIESTAKLNYSQTIFINFSGLIGTLCLVFLFVHFVDKEKYTTIGFNQRLLTLHIIYAVSIICLTISICFLLLLHLGQIEFRAYNFELLPFFQSIILFVIVAVNEEVFIRGYILKNLLQSFRDVYALILSSLFFTLFHLLNPNINGLSVLNIFLAGILLGLAYLYKRNLWFPIWIHFFWNFIQTHLGFKVSGQNFYSVIRTDFSISTIWNGGDFGFEGSILAVVIELSAIGLLWLFYKKQKKQNCVYEIILENKTSSYEVPFNSKNE